MRAPFPPRRPVLLATSWLRSEGARPHRDPRRITATPRTRRLSVTRRPSVTGQIIDPKGEEGAASFAGTRDRTPRDFVLLRAGADGEPLLLAANQDSHTLYALPLAACPQCAACPAGGGARLVAKVPSPVCIAVCPEDDVERAS